MTRACRSPEELRQRREPRSAGSSSQQTACEADRVHDRSRQPATRQPLRLAVDEAKVEASVVRDEYRVGCKLEEATNRDAGMRLSSQFRVVQAREGADRCAQRDAGIDQQLEVFRELEVAYAHGADLADARATGSQACRLEIHYDKGRVFEQDVGARRIG